MMVNSIFYGILRDPLCHLTWRGNGPLPGVEFTDKIKVKCKIPQIFHWPGDAG